jgi:hypothetical protein
MCAARWSVSGSQTGSLWHPSVPARRNCFPAPVVTWLTRALRTLNPSREHARPRSVMGRRGFLAQVDADYEWFSLERSTQHGAAQIIHSGQALGLVHLTEPGLSAGRHEHARRPGDSWPCDRRRFSRSPQGSGVVMNVRFCPNRGREGCSLPEFGDGASRRLRMRALIIAGTALLLGKTDAVPGRWSRGCRVPACSRRRSG